MCTKSVLKIMCKICSNNPNIRAMHKQMTTSSNLQKYVQIWFKIYNQNKKWVIKGPTYMCLHVYKNWDQNQKEKIKN